jgi:hypothetical protein
MYRRTLVLAAVAVVAFAVAGLAAAGRGDDPRSGKRALAGTWDVTLVLPGAPPGRVLATFDADGTTVESAAAPPATRGASHGVWKRIGHDLFSVTRVFFRFNPQTGAYLGTTKVNATVRVAPDGHTFAAVSVSELRDPAGNLVAGDLRGTATGARMAVEEIPDRP